MLRSVRLFRLFLKEQTDPGGFYSALAGDAADQLAEHTTVRDQTVLDIGGGAGYFTDEFRSRGANCYLLDLNVGEMMSRGRTPPGPPPRLGRGRGRRGLRDRLFRGHRVGRDPRGAPDDGPLPARPNRAGIAQALSATYGQAT